MSSSSYKLDMCDCQNNVAEAQGLGGRMLILNMFVLGLTSSFSHCIAMCGSIAMSQAAARIISDLNGQHDKNFKKVLCCIAWEYYLGKALTYMFLTCIMMWFGYIFKNSIIFKVVKNCVLLFAIFYFIISLIQTSYRIFNKKLIIPKVGFLQPISGLKLKLFQSETKDKKLISRLIIGLCLGLIPCGMVYSAVITIVNNTENLFLGSISALAFGLGTFPGLFILSYFGNLFFYRFKRLFDIAYFLTILWNTKILLSSI